MLHLYHNHTLPQKKTEVVSIPPFPLPESTTAAPLAWNKNSLVATFNLSSSFGETNLSTAAAKSKHGWETLMWLKGSWGQQSDHAVRGKHQESFLTLLTDLLSRSMQKFQEVRSAFTDNVSEWSWYVSVVIHVVLHHTTFVTLLSAGAVGQKVTHGFNEMFIAGLFH